LNFLKAFVELGDQISGFTLKIAGSGDDIPEFKKIAENTCNIEFLGEYAHKDLYNIISEFQIGILPYQINDFNNYTIHNKVFDYFALRIPVIVSEAVPLKRLVEETQSGLAVDCENTESIKSVLLKLRDYDWEKYSENAYLAFKSKYNWENDAKTLLNFTKQFI
jgi:glycosyltransferase involved in cell wall biosynthesis